MSKIITATAPSGRSLVVETERAMARRLEQERDFAEWDICYLEANCESPLEKILAPWLLTIQADFETTGPQRPTIESDSWNETTISVDELVLVPQYSYDKYRLDFALFYRCASWPKAAMIAIECDGHDYHDGTKEAAERDKRRNRALITAGWHLLRFSGREIHRDPEACIAEIQRLLGALYARDIAP